MSHDYVDPSKFEGKTILRVEAKAINIVRFWFTDGTSTALESDSFGNGIMGIAQCDTCIDACVPIDSAWAAKLGTIAHNRMFTRQEFLQATGQGVGELHKLMERGHVTREARNAYSITKSGWKAVETAVGVL